MATATPVFHTSPAFGKLSDSDQGPKVTLVNLILILLTGVVVVARSVIRFRVTRLFTLDNIAIFAGLAFAIAQTVCVQLAVNHGLGKRETDVSASSFVAYSKASYAANILYIFVLACSKISTAELIMAIQPQRTVRLATWAVEAVVALWTVSSLFAIAFQCHLPNPWVMAADRCVSLTGLYVYIGVLNILTDIALVLLPIPMMWNIQLAWAKKSLVLALFAIRICVPVVTIVQLVYLTHLFHHLPTQTWEATNPWILTQTVMNMSLMAACIPSLRRVVDGLRTRQTGLRVEKQQEFPMSTSNASDRNGSASGGASFWGRRNPKLHSKASNTNVSNKSGGSRQSSRKDGRDEEEEEHDEPMPYGYNVDKRLGNMASVTGGTKQDKAKATRAGVAATQEGWSSKERLRADHIHRTQEYTVEEDDHITQSSTGGIST